MSAQGQQTQVSNKKQRRKNARAKLQTNQTPDNEQNEVDPTSEIISNQDNHEQTNDISQATNGIQGLVLNIHEQVENVKENFTIYINNFIFNIECTANNL